MKQFYEISYKNDMPKKAVYIVYGNFIGDSLIGEYAVYSSNNNDYWYAGKGDGYWTNSSIGHLKLIKSPRRLKKLAKLFNLESKNA